jgi:stalled ribosome rescue protein Dom34
VAPLVTAADARDWLIVLVDSRGARLLHGNTDHVEELASLEDPVIGQHEGQGTTNHQRSVEHDVDAHLRNTAAEIDRRLRTDGYDRIILSGSPEILPRMEQALSNPARERLAGRFDAEVGYVHADDVRRAAAPCFDQDERRRERELLDRLEARLGRAERAAAGSEDVRAALDMAAVETLLFDVSCERDDGAMLERAIEDAVAQSADVVALRHHDGALEQHGHIAGLLRF